MITTRIVELSGDFSDPVRVWHWFLESCNRIDVAILGTIKHEFPGGGLTGLVIIGESHCAIHTWPERRYAWCELATCGDPGAMDEFEKVLSRITPLK